MCYNKKNTKILKNLCELHHGVMREELHTRMHPWLAGAQYRSTAVVLRVSFDLVNRTALSCIYILLYVPFLSMHSVVHAVEKKKEATR